MNDPIRSLRVWSWYVLAVGTGLLLIPNVVFDVLGIHNTDEVWIRVAGLVAIALGIVYAGTVRAGQLAIVRASVPARAVAVVGFVALWITGGPWQLLIFAALDLTGATWSWNTLRLASR